MKKKIHPLFEPIKKLFEFFILSVGFVGNLNLQKEFLNVHPELAPLMLDISELIEKKEQEIRKRHERKIKLL